MSNEKYIRIIQISLNGVESEIFKNNFVFSSLSKTYLKKTHYYFYLNLISSIKT